MDNSKKTFMRVAKKHQPRGLTILYEDRDIIVVDKINGLLSISTDTIKDNTAYYRLNNYVRKGNQKSKNQVFIVHRLDRDTSGVIVFAKSESAKLFLQSEWHNFSKSYYAIVCGKMDTEEGIFTSYLTENKAYRVYSVKDTTKGKYAKTAYRVLEEGQNYSLLEITLFTGRKNQIRVHLAENGSPVAGDKVYGMKNPNINRLMLHSASLTILHPYSKEKMTFVADIPVAFKALIKKDY